MPLDINLLLAYSPSPFFRLKLMLRLINPDINQSLKRKDRSFMLYSERCTSLIKAEIEICPY